MRLQMLAKFKILERNNENGTYAPITQDDIDTMVSPGGFDFIIDGKEVPFDFDAFSCAESTESGIFEYASGYGAFFNDFAPSDCYDEDLAKVGLSRDDLTPQFLASVSKIQEFFVNFEDKVGECECGWFEDNVNPEALLKVELLSIVFVDDDFNMYEVAQNVIDEFNGTKEK